MGANVVPGYSKDQSSLRSELAGIYVIVILVNVICQEHQILEGEIEVGCDNIKALRRAINMDYLVSPKSQPL